MGLFGFRKKKKKELSRDEKYAWPDDNDDDYDDDDDEEYSSEYRSYEEYLESGGPIDPCADALWLHDQE